MGGMEGDTAFVRVCERTMETSTRRTAEVYRGHDLVRMRHRLIGVMITL